MRRQHLLEIISDGESSTVEFKRKCASPEKIAREIIAFANTGGGYLLIGVDDDGSIVGVASEKSEQAEVEIACRFYCEPPIEPLIKIVHVRHHDVLVVRVAESTCKPHRLVCPPQDRDCLKTMDGRDKVYIRYADKSILASREMISILRSRNKDSAPVTLSIGRLEHTVFEHLENHERITVKEFARLAAIHERRAARLLVRLVRAGVLRIKATESADVYMLAR